MASGVRVQGLGFRGLASRIRVQGLGSGVRHPPVSTCVTASYLAPHSSAPHLRRFLPEALNPKALSKNPTQGPRGLSKSVMSRVISTLNGITPTKTLLATDLLSPLQVNPAARGGFFTVI